MTTQTTPAKILVVDDELGMRELLDLMLTREGYRVTCAASGKAALKKLETTDFDLMVCDIRLGDLTGISVLKKAKSLNPEIVVIMISAYASTENAVEAMNQGAYDYVPKPFDNRELKQSIAKALKLRTLAKEKENLDQEIQSHRHFDKIIGNHSSMMRIYDIIKQVAHTKTNILITGESGTGKELIANAIHSASQRKDLPFVVVNCGSIPETLMESEFFGHKKGAFTGANADKKGLFELAHLGTIFLDEVGELPLSMQVKLLRVVQEKSFRPVGGTHDFQVDVRIITATNKNLETEVIEGRFREDLFYRLNVISIKSPPLRERKSDLPILAQHFLEKYAKETGKNISKISSYAIDLLNRYDFPGNIRELENLIERSVTLSSTNIILPESLSLSIHHKKRSTENSEEGDSPSLSIERGVDLDQILSDVEKRYIQKAMEVTSGNKKKAAKLLGISFRSFRYRYAKLIG